MNKQIYIYSAILTIIASIICLFFDWRISIGLILGTICSFLYFYLLNMFISVEPNGKVHKGSILFGFIRIIVLALPLIAAYFLPNLINFFGAFAGVIAFRIVMLVIFFKNSKEVIS